MKERSITFVAYDTVCAVSARADGSCPLDECLEKIRARALGLQARLSMFEPGSELSRLSRGYAAGAPQPVSDELFELLEMNLLVARETRGAFDPTIGPVAQLWNVTSERPRIPQAREIEEALRRVGYRNIVLDRARKTATFLSEGMALDPGASGKGFAVGKVVEILRSFGVSSGYVNFGGNIFALGDKPSDGEPKPWRVAIQAPGEERGRPAAVVELRDTGISTSSWYERWFELDGVKYHHIFDPRTGRPCALEVRSVSIISPSAFFTDLASTGFFVAGIVEGAESLRRITAATGISLDYVVVGLDGAITASPGVKFA